MTRREICVRCLEDCLKQYARWQAKIDPTYGAEKVRKIKEMIKGVDGETCNIVAAFGPTTGEYPCPYELERTVAEP
jgi:hypothetical protein